MKSKLFRSKLVLATVAISSSAITNTAYGNPSPIFRPILQQIKSQLPLGMPFRLPSNIKYVGYTGYKIPLYSQIDRGLCSKGVCKIVLNDSPNCQARSCYIGSITVSSTSMPDSYIDKLRHVPTFPISSLRKIYEIRHSKSYIVWSETEKKLMINSEMAVLSRAAITLRDGVKGLFIVQNGGGVSTPASGTVLWNQDGYTYRLYQRASLTEDWQIRQDQKDELIKAAISMAKEPPITSR
jgi:hypothetical protein